MTIADEIAVVRTSTEQLHATLAALTPEQWETPGACGVWSVAEVVAHLTWGATLYQDLVRQALDGDGSPESEPPAPVDRSAMHASFARIAADYRQELGDRLLDAFAESGLALAAMFATVPDADWERPITHPSGVRPMLQLLHWRIMELSIHGWEIRHRLGLDAPLPDGSHETLLVLAGQRMRSTFVPREPLTEPLRYLFVLAPPVLRMVRLNLYGDRFELDPVPDGLGSDVVLTLHPDLYILAFMGRLSWRQIVDAGAVAVGGRQDLAADLAGWFQ
jgi:uncharacterized protein (TIGR03083 family)